MNLISEKQRFLASLACVFLTLWLTLYCQHCGAAVLPADMAAGQPHTNPVDHHHAGSPPHSTHGDCLGKCLQRDVTAESGRRPVLFLYHPVPMPAAMLQGRTGFSPDDTGPFMPRSSPDRAVLHPLSLNCIQLK